MKLRNKIAVLLLLTSGTTLVIAQDEEKPTPAPEGNAVLDETVLPEVEKEPSCEVDSRASSLPAPVPVPVKCWGGFLQSQNWCTINAPNQVKRYQVECSNASFLRTSISDAFIPGDHWQVTAKVWDAAPNTAIATSPGPYMQFGNAVVHNYGGTPSNRGNLKAEVDCSYLHGVNVFAASSLLQFWSDGYCSINPTPTHNSTYEIYPTP